jgi:pyruvate dehydrogenase E1 component alpha subunit
MLLLRRFEEKTGQLYGMGLIGGFCHLYIGEEAVAIGLVEALNQDDALITSYRDHGLMLARDSDPKTVMAELLGRESGCSKGKGGSMHMFDLPKGFYGGHGIVGAQVPLGTGLAFANKYRQNKNISVTLFGDGACHQGQVYESFNMAKLWGLPALYIIENNGYSMGTSVARCSSVNDLYKRGESFGIPGQQVDGMDFFDVHEKVSQAVKYVREKQSPMLLEMKTYRYRGHSMSDPATYRTKEEVDSYKSEKDPIMLLKNYLQKNKILTEEEFKAIEKKVKLVVNDAADFAKNSPEPAASELYTDVYS